jgi:hypothetical protein
MSHAAVILRCAMNTEPYCPRSAHALGTQQQSSAAVRSFIHAVRCKGRESVQGRGGYPCWAARSAPLYDDCQDRHAVTNNEQNKRPDVLLPPTSRVPISTFNNRLATPDDRTPTCHHQRNCNGLTALTRAPHNAFETETTAT